VSGGPAREIGLPRFLLPKIYAPINYIRKALGPHDGPKLVLRFLAWLAKYDNVVFGRPPSIEAGEFA
jgi:hypothetical protein